MGDLWGTAKPLIEAGVLGAVLILAIRMWLHTGKKWEQMVDNYVKSEKEHSKEMLKLQTENNKELLKIVRQYDMTLTSVDSTLSKMAEESEEA